MAKVSAHGSIVGTVHYLTYSKRFMSDGVILKNAGFGWKLHGKCKPGVAVADVYARAIEHQAANRAKRPAYAEYVRLLHDIAGMATRWKLHAAIEMMPDDTDGVWSECCDGYGDNVHADIDEVAKVCRAYQAVCAA